jgi:hypothetical protein
MIQYQTQLKNAPPQTAQSLQAFQQQGLPYQYNQNHADVMNGMMQRQAVDMSRYAQQMQDAYATKQQQEEMQNVLAGLTQLSQDRQNQQNLGNSRLQAMLGFQGSLLNDLLR